MELEPHPLAKLFPLMSPEESNELRASIKAHGLRQPITLFEGKILDGINRWIACKRLGIRPKTVEFAGSDPLAFVLDLNCYRRHLDVSQRALIAGRLATLKWGGDRKGKDQELNLSLDIPNAARALGVSSGSVKAARVVLEDGAPELVRAVDQKRLAISAARQLTRLPRRDQVRITAESNPKKRRQLIRAAKDHIRREPKPEPPPAELTLSSKTVGKTTKLLAYSVSEWEALAADDRVARIAAGFEAKGGRMNEQSGSSIEWARWSHNTVTGCLHDCPYCYARDIANKMYSHRFTPTFYPERLAGPGGVEVPSEAKTDESYRNVFANSMSDLFGQWVPKEWIDATIEMARKNPQWNFLTLTKFPQRAAEFEFPANWWMGTTVDAQSRVANAEKAFFKIRCKTKWLSVEPLLEPLSFERLDLFQWLVIGGASESTKTPKWVPEFDWVGDLTAAARKVGCRVYHKTNLELGDAIRLREFPWVKPVRKVLPDSFRYLKGLRT